MSKSLNVQVPPLPPTNAKLRMKTKQRKLHHYLIDAIMNGAYEKIRPYLETVSTSKGVTGSLMTDRVTAAIEMQKFGNDHGVAAIQKANLAEIDHAMTIALRSICDENGQRIDRKSRRAAALAAPKE